MVQNVNICLFQIKSDFYVLITKVILMFLHPLQFQSGYLDGAIQPSYRGADSLGLVSLFLI